MSLVGVANLILPAEVLAANVKEAQLKGFHLCGRGACNFSLNFWGRHFIFLSRFEEVERGLIRLPCSNQIGHLLRGEPIESKSSFWASGCSEFYLKMSADAFTIIVKSPVQATDLQVELPRSSSVLDLKQQLRRDHPSAPEPASQRLIYGGRLLRDEEMLADAFRQVRLGPLFVLRHDLPALFLQRLLGVISLFSHDFLPSLE